MLEVDFVCKDSIQMAGLFHAVHSINVLKTQITMLSSEKSTLSILFYGNLQSFPTELQTLFLTEVKLHARPFLLHAYPTLESANSAVQILARDTSNQEVMAHEYNLYLDQWIQVDADKLEKKVKQEKTSFFQGLSTDKCWITVNCQAMIINMMKTAQQSHVLYQSQFQGAATTTNTTKLLPCTICNVFLPLCTQYEIKQYLWNKSRISDVVSFWELLQIPLVVQFFSNQEKDYKYWELFQLLKTYIAYKSNVYGLLLDRGPSPSRNSMDLVTGLDTMFRTMHGQFLLCNSESIMNGNGMEQLLSKVPLFHEFFFLWTGDHDRRLVNLKSWIQFYQFCLSRSATAADILPSLILEKEENAAPLMLVYFAMHSLMAAAKFPNETEWLFRMLVEHYAPSLISLFCYQKEDAEKPSTLLFELMKWCSVYFPAPDNKIVCLFGPSLCFVIPVVKDDSLLETETQEELENVDEIQKVTLDEVLRDFHGQFIKHEWMHFMKSSTSIFVQSKRHRILVSQPSSRRKCNCLDILGFSEIVAEDFVKNLTKNILTQMKDITACVSYLHKSQVCVYRPVGKSFHEKVVEWLVMLVNIRRTQAITNSMMMLTFGFCLQEEVGWKLDEIIE